MRYDIDNRRRTFVEMLGRNGSMKIALMETSKRYGVTKNALKVDWGRRISWPKQVFEGVNNPVFTFLYLLEIRGALNQIESLIRKTENPNCKLGAIRTKIDTLLKLVNLQRVVGFEDILARIEKLEARLDDLQKAERIGSEEVED